MISNRGTGIWMHIDLGILPWLIQKVAENTAEYNKLE